MAALCGTAQVHTAPMAALCSTGVRSRHISPVCSTHGTTQLQKDATSAQVGPPVGTTARPLPFGNCAFGCAPASHTHHDPKTTKGT